MTNKYAKYVKSLFNTEEGRYILKVWQADYVTPSAMCNSVEGTIYNLAQKEFVQGFIDQLNEPLDLEQPHQ